MLGRLYRRLSCPALPQLDEAEKKYAQKLAFAAALFFRIELDRAERKNEHLEEMEKAEANGADDFLLSLMDNNFRSAERIAVLTHAKEICDATKDLIRDVEASAPATVNRFTSEQWIDFGLTLADLRHQMAPAADLILFWEYRCEEARAT
ncbi:hypothetical protein [Phyllobacterium lublinensis]|uniref:hypothetical protein n=1 Tax=Phyllobacterium lublinensis TaxID=2875708 RepID=UPI001CCB584E|nr:hypothetical protein [Phyllobacterium sp. 2063]MBZ9656445.1 hypothetical protein [Phyllobacterium sp. 2063]